MRLGLFTDAHYSSQVVTEQVRQNAKSLEKIRNAYDFFLKENCELVVCLGDLIDTEDTVEKEIDNLRAISEIIKNSPIRTVCVMGNHDAFVLTPEDYYSILGLEPPKDMNINGCNLIFLDACYFKNGRHYAPGDSDWTDCFVSDDETLRTKLLNSSGSTYIFLHQSIDPSISEDHRVFNADKLFDMINKSGAVKTVFQGHYHWGKRSEYDGVKYITLPAMCENEQCYFVFDI